MKCVYVVTIKIRYKITPKELDYVIFISPRSRLLLASPECFKAHIIPDECVLKVSLLTTWPSHTCAQLLASKCALTNLKARPSVQ